ncbi:hypothetical protein ZIOFF_023246 [Zingiber officinale]|uniref:Uncharacterized protein n=1 Tax=Zingiber officinale TaxID=94328 RepID=A0A8J5LKS8_ZINOF|nr:hypothetical protein ZIOFF_023246 [Zingiber officinale]
MIVSLLNLVVAKFVGAEYILDLQKKLSLLADKATNESNGTAEDESITSMTPLEKLRSQLDDAIASECPFCGDLMIREISLPFVLHEDAEEIASWEIKPHVTSQKILPMTI